MSMQYSDNEGCEGFVLWNEKCSVMFWKILYDLRTALNIQSYNLHYYEYTVCLGRGNRVTKYSKIRVNNKPLYMCVGIFFNVKWWQTTTYMNFYILYFFVMKKVIIRSSKKISTYSVFQQLNFLLQYEKNNYSKIWL